MNRRCHLFVVLVFIGFMGGANVQALELDMLPSAKLTAQRDTGLDSFAAPVAVFDGSAVATIAIEGAVTRSAWRISLPGLTPLQIMAPIRDQILAQGYVSVFECEAVDCGGFDFRFNIEVLPGPNMYVNISRYRYLTAVRGDPEAPDQMVGVLVSVAAGSAYVQVITVDREDNTQSETIQSDPVNGQEILPVGVDRFANDLLSRGHVILQDLDFSTGTSDLGRGPFASLAELAGLLRENTDLRIALVGHTDTVGGLDTNIALSRARAQSVRSRLIEQYGAEASRLDAEGMGYLSPIATNLTVEGRDLNRRVEAVLLNTE